MLLKIWDWKCILNLEISRKFKDFEKIYIMMLGARFTNSRSQRKPSIGVKKTTVGIY